MFHCETMIWYLSLVEPFQVAGGLFFILEVDDAKEQKQLKVQPHHISEMEIWHKVSHCQGQENHFFSVKRNLVFSNITEKKNVFLKRKKVGYNLLFSYNWCISFLRCTGRVCFGFKILKPTRRMEEYCFFWVAPGPTEIVVVTVVCASLNLWGKCHTWS